MVRLRLVRLEYQLEVKVWLYMEKIHNKNLKLKPNIVNGVSIYINVHNYCIPVSDRVCEGSGDSCTGMRSLDGALEVSGRMASFVGVVSAIQIHIILKPAIYKNDFKQYSKSVPGTHKSPKDI